LVPRAIYTIGNLFSSVSLPRGFDLFPISLLLNGQFRETFAVSCFFFFFFFFSLQADSGYALALALALFFLDPTATKPQFGAAPNVGPLILPCFPPPTPGCPTSSEYYCSTRPLRSARGRNVYFVCTSSYFADLSKQLPRLSFSL